MKEEEKGMKSEIGMKVVRGRRVRSGMMKEERIMVLKKKKKKKKKYKYKTLLKANKNTSKRSH